MDENLAKKIGVAARASRTALGLTQADAAERVGITSEFYARIERGQTLPSVPTLAAIADALGVSADRCSAAREHRRVPMNQAPHDRRRTRPRCAAFSGGYEGQDPTPSGCSDCLPLRWRLIENDDDEQSSVDVDG